MKSFIVLAVVVASVLAAPPNTDSEAQITNQNFDNIGVDGFSHGYLTSNGISAQASGQLRNAGSENEALVMQGEYSYTGPDGVVYKVTYTADEEGFKPIGAHIPQP